MILIWRLRSASSSSNNDLTVRWNWATSSALLSSVLFSSLNSSLFFIRDAWRMSRSSSKCIWFWWSESRPSLASALEDWICWFWRVFRAVLDSVLFSTVSSTYTRQIRYKWTLEKSYPNEIDATAVLVLVITTHLLFLNTIGVPQCI